MPLAVTFLPRLYMALHRLRGCWWVFRRSSSAHWSADIQLHVQCEKPSRISNRRQIRRFNHESPFRGPKSGKVRSMTITSRKQRASEQEPDRVGDSARIRVPTVAFLSVSVPFTVYRLYRLPLFTVYRLLPFVTVCYRFH